MTLLHLYCNQSYFVSLYKNKIENTVPESAAGIISNS